MTPHTLPAGLILRLAGDILTARADAIRRRLQHNPRHPATSKTDGRRVAIEEYATASRQLSALRATGEVSAEVAGLLLAWVGGHTAALGELEEIDERIADLVSTDVVGACRLLLDAK